MKFAARKKLVEARKAARKFNSAATATRPPKREVSRPIGLDDGSELTAEEIQFAFAMERYKLKTGRRFPTCKEVLAVLKTLGYAQRTRGFNNGKNERN